MRNEEQTAARVTFTVVAGANVARHLPLMARERPDQTAVVSGVGRDRAGKVIYRRQSFAGLHAASDRLAWGLTAYGLRKGMRVLLMVPAGVPLISLTFALMKAGCVPILIDPAMGRRNLAQCIAEVEPEAFIGVPRAHLLRLIFPRSCATIRYAVSVGPALPGAAALRELDIPMKTAFPLADMRSDDPAAIVFTSGSTGTPKGVLYTHGMFEAQIHTLRDLFGIAAGEVEMPAFPLFALFNVALGVTSAIPPIDPTRPAQCDPAAVVEFIRDLGVTSTFGSPAIWEKVTAYCLTHGIQLPSLRRVLMAGAPVPIHLHERLHRILSPTADSFTPYGATEALPVTSISGREVLAAHTEYPSPLAGTCIGYPVPGVEVAIIPITDEPIHAWQDTHRLPPGVIGEICVSGATVTHTYVGRPQATALAKISDGNRIWHRMGDLGYFDERGRLWFYGRKSQRVITAHGTLFTEPVERLFNQHPAVARSALVGIGKPGTQLPVVVVERRRDRAISTSQLIRELRQLATTTETTAIIQTFLIHPSFPVDIRHNAKIFREQLADWAARRLCIPV
ncbi:MAG TPA: peptide synthase [Chloroflexus aurantiacus]|jgi:acyl-CoA synthetase (AMP-forming)/AMP-acid ligase II|uniref:AMP-dependent synthetase and ligase n=1 Tax=Chloroflexus aurantiacus (strain ATCC 29366 / DSM 635 / J-10-fl) TaxID=324602 RepID=A9WA33_CHLAA|nr:MULTISPECIES: fatty acid CoA ligase family protein [Chloroflexus]ABY36715.1 AMP-dependent synthetase and ligase [Chloroflexus aurantiacus J-10-fl]RMG50449.1 MAG: peptide synthase [Chloroflexota bacterium]HBW67630.1 peptide synthase [Chloroflexus aurantiacus]